MLLHDIAKGKKGDHSVNGAIVASTVCPRLGLSDDETEIVKWLVLNHLLLSKTAFRYELGDPKIIKDFAEKVKTVEKLKLLLIQQNEILNKIEWKIFPLLKLIFLDYILFFYLLTEETIFSKHLGSFKAN